jgi:hypothetical protein
MSPEFALPRSYGGSPDLATAVARALAHVTDCTHQVAWCLHARRMPMSREFVLPGRNDRSPHFSECGCTSLAHVTDCTHRVAWCPC